MEKLTAQLASTRVVHLRGRFEINAPSKLLEVKGIKRAYLVPYGSEDVQCMVVEPVAPLSVKSMHELVLAIAKLLGCADVEWLRAVERSSASVKAWDIYDWGHVRG